MDIAIGDYYVNRILDFVVRIERVVTEDELISLDGNMVATKVPRYVARHAVTFSNGVLWANKFLYISVPNLEQIYRKLSPDEITWMLLTTPEKVPHEYKESD